jgi:hypothetical protein
MSRSFLVPLLLPADPTNALEAATKQYVDAKTQGSAFFEFMWSNTTTAPPTGSEIRINNATPSAATKVWVRYLTADGVDVKNRILHQAVSGTQFYIQDKDNSANWYLYNLTADSTDQTTYAELTVTYASGAGTIPAQRVTAGVLNSGGGGGGGGGTKLSALTAIAGGSLNASDLVEVVDVSDTAMAGSGTNKKTTLGDLSTFIGAGGGVPTTRLISTTAPLTGGGDLSADRTIVISDFTATTKGAVPNPGGSTGRYLKDDGTWATVPGGTPADDSITNAKLANMPTLTVKGNNTGATADPADLTVAQLKTLLGLTSVDVSGVVDTSTTQIIGGTKTFTVGVLIDSPSTAFLGLDRGATSNFGQFEFRTNGAQKWAVGVWNGGTEDFRILNSVSSVAALQITASTDLCTVKGDPTAALGIATKQYVDTKGSGVGPLFGFLFDTTQTAGTSTNGLRLNATPALATAVYVNYTCREGADLKTRILAGTAGDRLYIQNRVSSAAYRIYELTGAPTDNTTYATINVVHRTGSGAFGASEEIIAGFTSPPLTIGSTAPSSPLVNDLWVDTT